MTIPRPAAWCWRRHHGQGGEVYVFDMGEPVRIADLRSAW